MSRLVSSDKEYKKSLNGILVTYYNCCEYFLIAVKQLDMFVGTKIYITRKSQSYFITSNHSQQRSKRVEWERQCSRHSKNEQSKSDTVDAREKEGKSDTVDAREKEQ